MWWHRSIHKLGIGFFRDFGKVNTAVWNYLAMSVCYSRIPHQHSCRWSINISAIFWTAGGFRSHLAIKECAGCQLAPAVTSGSPHCLPHSSSPHWRIVNAIIIIHYCTLNYWIHAKDPSNTHTNINIVKYKCIKTWSHSRSPNKYQGCLFYQHHFLWQEEEP